MKLTDEQLTNLKNHIYIGNSIYSWFSKNEIPPIKPAECIKQLGDKFGHMNINRILQRVKTQLKNEEKGKDNMTKAMNKAEQQIFNAMSEITCEEDCVFIHGMLEHFQLMVDIKSGQFED